ncbi:MAG: iron-containing alcohol dehydrogenase, partial [Planctomycetes bacterium]|nr:iron-containing alcohol dehydrogenase [Planctomycetota bacterium]
AREFLMASSFSTVPKILHGQGAFDQLGGVVSELGDRALIVSGQGSMRRQGFLDRAEALLEKAGVASEVFEGVPPEPELASVDAVRSIAAECRAEVIIGIGGGSALDVAKAAAGLLKQPLPIADYFYGAPFSDQSAAFVAVPSTFGTGSEVTRNAVLSDPEKPLKQSIRSESFLAHAAIVDPELGRGAPAEVKAASTLDALTQAIEAFFSIRATPVTESLSFGAVALLAAHIENFVFHSDDLDAAENCATGSLMAGLAFGNAGLGIVHGVVHPLGIRYHQPHGLLCGVLLPHALRFNRDHVPGQYALLCGIVKQDIAEFCTTLLQNVGLPGDLSGLGAKAEDLPILAKESVNTASTKTNPRPVRETDIIEILERVFGLKQ